MKHLKTFENFEIDYTSGSEVETIDSVIAKVKQSHDSGWYGEHLQESTECVNLDNGWDDDLEALRDIPGVPELLEKIGENSFDLWEGSLEETFPCVLTESLYEDGDSKFGPKGDVIVEYNGWYEDLLKLGDSSIKESTDYASSNYEIPKWLSDQDKKKVQNYIKHLKSTTSHVQYDKYVDTIDKIISDATPTKKDGSKMCMKDADGTTVGR